MRYASALLFLLSTLYAQEICTTYNTPGTTTTNVNCSDGTSALVRPLNSLPNLSTYEITLTALPPVTPRFIPPPVRPIPLPALSIIPPPAPMVNGNLMMMAAMAASNRPPSARQTRRYCKKHSGENWAKRNWQGIVVAEGVCQ